VILTKNGGEFVTILKGGKTMAGSNQPINGPEPPAEIVASLCGAALVTRVRRVFYVFDDEVDREFGPVELTFSDGAAVVFDAGADGEALAVRRGAWRDPFAEPLSEANRSFVREHGKWTAFDVSASPVSRSTHRMSAR